MSVIVNPTAATAATSIGGSVVGGTAPAILFINPNGILAQDPTNFGWDSTNKILLIEGQNAIFRVPNASGDNWFEAGAGNVTVTGFSNFGTGPGTLANVTSGNRNFGVGAGVFGALTTGFNNFGIGEGVAVSATQALQNFGIGLNALNKIGSVNATDANNIGIGIQCLVNLGSGGISNQMIAIGTGCGFGIPSGTGSTLMGFNILTAATANCSGCTIIGSGAASNTSQATNTTILGPWAGPSAALGAIIVLDTGNTVPILDWGYTRGFVWSMKGTSNGTNPVGLQIYNTIDTGVPPTNYERFCLDWNLTANTARIATQAGGTGTVRIIAIDGFQKAGAPAAGDIPAGTWGLINDTSGNATWLCYNNSGTIRKVQLV